MEETWRDVVGFDPYYEISDMGSIRSKERTVLCVRGGGHTQRRKAKAIKPRMTKFGYLHVGLFRNGKQRLVRVHRLVATAFIPNPNGFPVVNHLNAIRTDNRAYNLEWCTDKMNVDHATKRGAYCIQKSNKLTLEKAREIRKRHQDGENTVQLGLAFGVSNVQIGNIVRNKCWREPVMD